VQQRLDANPKAMRRRRETVEHPFGTMKARMGATHFLTKTLPKVAAEMGLSVLAYNLTRHEHSRHQAADGGDRGLRHQLQPLDRASETLWWPGPSARLRSRPKSEKCARNGCVAARLANCCPSTPPPPRYHTWGNSGIEPQEGTANQLSREPPRPTSWRLTTTEAAVENYVGLDVSLKLTAICIVDGTGKIVREGMVASNPEVIAAFIKSHAPHVVRIGLEAGATSTWLWTELNMMGLPVICIDARHAKAALRCRSTRATVTMRLASRVIMQCGWYKEVRVKDLDSHAIKALLVSMTRKGASIEIMSMARGLTTGQVTHRQELRRVHTA